MKTKLQSLLLQLNQGLVERENVLKLALLTTLTGENLVLVGPPGTGKSLVARRIADCFAPESVGTDHPAYFEYLLTKFSTPEEIFGPLSISALKADRFHRNTAGYLPTVQMAFLDEIFKASSSILNALLTILNERLYHNGTQVQPVPLRALIAASNELPNDQEELNALYDRFLVRVFVDYVSASSLPRLFEPTTTPQHHSTDLLTADDLVQLQQAAQQVTFPSEIVQAVQDIWLAHKEAFKEDRREGLSDRRLKKVIALMRMSAATNGRREADLSDVLLLKDCLWNHADNATRVRELVMKTLQCYTRQVPMNLDSANNLNLSFVASIDDKVKGRLNAVVQGFVGSGTADDPFLIETVDNLKNLAHLEIGCRNYYFKQANNLNIDSVSWPTIVFKGRYDGQGYCIGVVNYSKSLNLFDLICDSVVSNVVLKDIQLSKIIKTSQVRKCSSNIRLFDQSNTVEVLACEVESVASLIEESRVFSCKVNRLADRIVNSLVESCESMGSCLVENELIGSKIKNCLINLQVLPDAKSIASIVNKSDASQICNCYVHGEISYFNESIFGFRRRFSGIARSITNKSIIENCVVGNIDFSEPLVGRICESSTKGSVLGQNMVDDRIKGQGRVYHGESIAAEQLKKHYFEHNLHWDFDTIWEWDVQKNHPVLRQIGLQAQADHLLSDRGMKFTPIDVQDLLTTQICNNLWL